MASVRATVGSLLVLFLIFPFTSQAQTTVSPTSLSFGSMALGNTSAGKSVTLKNTQAVALTDIAASVTPGYVITANTCGTTLAAGKNCTFTVAFAPVALGSITGALTITHSASTSPQTVALSGTGISPTSETPASLSFPATTVGSNSAAQSVTLKNNQNVPLTAISIATSSDYTQTNNCGTSLNSGASCKINVTFHPLAGGARNGILSIGDSAIDSPQTVPLTGTGMGVTLSVTPATLAYGNQLIGTVSAAQSISVSNTGSLNVSIGGISASGEFAQSNNCPASLASGATCTIAVTFAPQSTGAKSGAVTINDNATGGPHTVALSGTGASLALGVAPGTLAFGNQLINTTSAAQTVTVTNTGTLAVGIASATVSGEFAQSNNCPASLAAGASCSVAVTFSPTTTGSKSGTLTINDNATGGPHSVALSGSGASMTASASPASLAFGDQLQNTTSSAQTVTLTNTGTLSINVSGVTVSGDFAQTNNCPATLMAGANCAINVTFTPQGTGAKSGTLTINDNASGQTVSLSGNGSSRVVSVAPGSLSFADQLQNTTSAAQAVTITNTGTLGVTFSGIAASGEFTESDNCGTSLAAGAACTVNVVFAPQSAGAKSGTLTINDDASGPQTIALSGNGTSIAVSVAPATLTFGDEPTGATSSPQTITVSNTGSLALNIAGVSINGEFAQTNNCPATLAAGSSCAISATFTPQSPGAKTGTITVADNAPGGPHTVALFGNGAAPALASIRVTPSNARLLLSGTATFSASAVFTDGSTQDATAGTVWISSDPTTVSVSGNTATAIALGTATLTAQYQGVTGTATIIAKGAGSVNAGNLNFARSQHLSVTLADGKVLVLGGIDANGQAVPQAELFDPATAQFSLTGSMLNPRTHFNAVRLQDGRVLVVGGGFNAAEIYDPATGAFAPAGNTTMARSDSAATVMNDGRVLITGGVYDPSSYNYLPSAEIYDPQSGTFTATEPMIAGRREHSSTLLQDGRVLIVGGDQTVQEGNAEIFDPATGVFTATGSMPVQRFSHTATRLQDGRVLIAAGYGTETLPVDAFLYDPASGAFSPAGSLHTSRYATNAALLPDGRVLVGGGFAWYYSTASVEIWDPSSQTFAISKELNSRRGFGAASLLNDGEVLFTGGNNNDGVQQNDTVNSAELYSGSTTLTGVQVTPQQATITASGWMQFRLAGSFADGTTQEMSVIADWSVSDPNVAYMSEYSGSVNAMAYRGQPR